MPLNLTISPGDHISGAVTVNGSNVSVALSDATTGQSTSKVLQMQSPDLSSAEWIAEAPSSCDASGSCQPLPLSDFGTVQFTHASATAGGHTGPISDPQWTTTPVALNGSAGGYGVPDFVGGQASNGAQVSSLSPDGSAFTVSYVNGDSGAGSTSSDSSGGYAGSGYGGGDGYASGGGGTDGYSSGGGQSPSGGYDPGAWAYSFS